MKTYTHTFEFCPFQTRQLELLRRLHNPHDDSLHLTTKQVMNAGFDHKLRNAYDRIAHSHYDDFEALIERVIREDERANLRSGFLSDLDHDIPF
ncbi:hypothetical protein ACG74X_09095 [Marivita sp. S0852]|uniref:hypothetical protein n=1 Tax=Marivita sp. S0852 TaxID=3373893 RepID=UPI003981CB7A